MLQSEEHADKMTNDAVLHCIVSIRKPHHQLPLQEEDLCLRIALKALKINLDNKNMTLLGLFNVKTFLEQITSMVCKSQHLASIIITRSDKSTFSPDPQLIHEVN
eukprot:m.239429 g.239429  ORF g.239429 m.239429 type:complete len:105 (+) comp13937_c0_seq12:389-703(+)